MDFQSYTCDGFFDELLTPDGHPRPRGEPLVKRLAALMGPERIFLNPDCGFGTFADRPVGTPDVAFKKLCTLAQAAEALRAGL